MPLLKLTPRISSHDDHKTRQVKRRSCRPALRRSHDQQESSESRGGEEPADVATKTTGYPVPAWPDARCGCVQCLPRMSQLREKG